MASAWAEHAERLIGKHVDGLGRVDYGALGGDGLLREALDGIAVLAFYLNAYNLAALGIAAHLAGRSPRFARQGLRGGGPGSARRGHQSPGVPGDH